MKRLAAPIARIIALAAVAPLGLFGDPVCEPVHAEALCLCMPSSCYCA